MTASDVALLSTVGVGFVGLEAEAQVPVHRTPLGRGRLGAMASFVETYRRSLEHPEGFWAEAAADIEWTKPWDVVLDKGAAPSARWFVGGVLNTCYNALDRHADGGRGDQPALIYDSAVIETVETFTYRELRDEVARFAGVLARHGVEKGDRVVIYMPMIPQAVIAMLACARLGAVHSVVFRRLRARRSSPSASTTASRR